MKEEKRKAKKHFEDSEERYKSLITAARDIIFTLSPEGKITYLNPVFNEITGWSKEEWIGRPFKEIIHPEDVPIAMKRFHNTVSGEKTPLHNLRILKKSGDYIWGEFTTIARVKDGKIIEIEGIARDITERKNLERKRKKHAKDLEKLFKLSKEVASTTNLDSLYRKIIKTSKDLLNLDFSTLLLLSDDKKFLTVMDTLGFPESMRGTFSISDTLGVPSVVIKTKEPATVTDLRKEKRFEVPEGVLERGVTSAICVPMMLEEDIFGVLVGHTRDRREFTENDVAIYQSIGNLAAVAVKNSMHLSALKESEEKYRDLFENASDIIQSVDIEGRFLEVNSKWCKVLGYTRGEAEKLTIKDILRRDQIPHCEVELKKVSSGKEAERIETVFVSKNGEEITVEGSANARFVDGKFVSTRGVFRDITERKKAEEKIKRYAEELEQSNRLKELFIDIMRHDLLNPIGIAGGFLNILQWEEEDRERLGYLQKIERNLNKSIEMIETASKLAKLEDISELTWEKLDLDSMTASVLKNLKPLFDEKGVTANYNSTGKAFIVANPIFEDVITNLITNALKYSPPGSEIKVDMKNREDHLKIIVKDEGEGIPDEFKDTIFERFERLEKKGVKGAGLGLAITKRIVNLHGGRIRVEDNHEGGAVFVVEIPKSHRD